jgi:amino acid adenylation domain-containing protein
MDHDAPLVAAMLGVLTAGHAVVVLNRSDPPARLDAIRRQVGAEIAVVDRDHAELAREAGFTELVEIDACPTADPEGSDPPPAPADLAAVMFTSGSTGRPKGVMHTHHTLLHTALRHSTALGLVPEDRVALLASPSGGHGMGTIWMTLLSGATICPFPVMDRGVAGLPEWLAEHRITVLGLSASLFRRLIPLLDGAKLPDLRLVRVGSEQAVRADFDAWRRQLGGHRVFANVFSLTEAGGVAHFLLNSADAPPDGPLPVGRPAPGVEISLVGKDGRPVPPGEIGEIVVSSAHLTPGYWRDDRLTSERFGHGRRDGERTVHTADLGRLDDDGNLVVVGRRDEQVKIRGYRVELTEVESALRALPGVRAAAASTRPTRYGDARLVAYVAIDPGAEATTAAVREALRATLPEASVPTEIAFLDELPLTAHGKVDRRRLDELPAPASPPLGERAAASATERELSSIWAAALELDRVGRDADFFDLAGDSLAAAEIGAAVLERFGVEVDLRAFSSHPSVARMAGLIDGRRNLADRRPAPLGKVSRDGPLLCTFAQERIWRQADTIAYTSLSLTQLDADVDLESLEAAIRHVAAQHEPFRTTFAVRDGRPIQVIHPAGSIDVSVTGPDPEDARGAGLRAVLEEEMAEPFDLERGPLSRFRFVRMNDGRHHLIRANHHLITDRGSWRIFFDDLVPAYEAIRHRRPPPSLDPDRLQYADYAVWERKRLDPSGELYQRQVSWWRGALDRPPDPLRLPFARPTPKSDAGAAEGRIWWGLHPRTTGSLDSLGRETGATRYAIRLALFAALLSLETDQSEVTVGAYVDTRRLPETRSMFGYFANLISLVLPFDPRAGLRAWSAKVRELLTQGVARSDLPHQLVCEELLATGRIPPEINAIFVLRYPLPELPFGTAEVSVEQGPVAMPWGFTFAVNQREESTRCQVDFDASLHDPSAVRGFTDRYAALAGAAGARPDVPLGDLYTALRG